MVHEHETVLLNEAVDALAIRPDGRYMDATFGRGGHSQEVLKQLGADGHLIVVDRDPEALAYAHALAASDSRVEVYEGAFSEVLRAYADSDAPRLDGILFDLGVSSPQLDDPLRGFSFQHNGPLDMRMDPTSGVSAAEWLQDVDETELANVIYQYGEERLSRRIARVIVAQREVSPLTTTLALAECVAKAVPRRGDPSKHPATRTFQAIRIYINDEMGEIQRALLASVPCLAENGRLSVISFHSLEDRLVKQFMRYLEHPDRHIGDDFPDAWEKTALGKWHQPLLRRVGKFQAATDQESGRNRRARSAKLRVAEKYSCQP